MKTNKAAVTGEGNAPRIDGEPEVMNARRYNSAPTTEQEQAAERDAIALLGGNAYTIARLNIRKQIAAMSDRDSFRLCEVKRFDRVYSRSPNDVGSIEVEYYCPTLQAFNHALFGVTLTGEVTCYAN